MPKAMYEYTKKDIKELIANNLGVSVDRVSISYVYERQFDMGDWTVPTGEFTFSKLEVTVN